jgi:Tfp pilus assembly protein PilV
MMKKSDQNQENRAIRRREAGFTLIDVMVAMGLGAIAVITTIGVIVQAGRVRREQNMQTSLLAVRTMIFNALQRYDDFQTTIESSANTGGTAKFACLQAFTCTATAGGGNFTLYRSDYNIARAALVGQVILYDARNVKAGFDEDGLNCTAIAATAPDKMCPIRVDFSWANKCTPNCNPALIEIGVKFTVYREWTPKEWTSSKKIIEAKPYDFTLIKSVYPSTEGPIW